MRHAKRPLSKGSILALTGISASSTLSISASLTASFVLPLIGLPLAGLPLISLSLVGLLLVGLSASPTFAQSGSFQQIRTFDPVRGLVPGNGVNSATTPAPALTPAPAPNDTTPAALQNQRRAPASIYSGTTESTPPNGYDQNAGKNTPTAGWHDSDNDPEQPTPPRRNSNYTASPAARNNSSNTQEQDYVPQATAHHKHHHKFLFFGHHDDSQNEDQRTDTASGAQQDSNPSRTYQPSARYRTPQLPVTPSTIQTPPTSSTVTDMSSVIPRSGATPSAPLPVIPPDPPPRPANPVVDQNLRLPAPMASGAKPSLAWRTRAWRLATEPDDSTTLSKHPYRILNCSTEEALAAIADCCKSKGGQIIGQSVSAGQLGARFSDAATGRAVLVFVVKPIGNNRTILKACADSDRAQKIALANDLIVQAAAIIDGKGLL
ncbi:MAG TPA: hypothetical protein V6C86_00190 [Oculatellaceae cyanobacterium]